MKKTGERRKEKGERRKLRGLSWLKTTRHSSLITHHSSLVTRHFLLFTFYFLLSMAFATTYKTDASGGPETLGPEVTAAFDAWKALDNKLEIAEAEENPESVFQYGASDRFNPDTLSITVQRQQEGRQLIILLSPNAENRKRILLHEAGIAIGLTPQSPPSLAASSIPETTPNPSAAPTDNPGESTPNEPTSSEPTPSETNPEAATTDGSQSDGSTTDTSNPETATDTTTEPIDPAPTDTTEPAQDQSNQDSANGTQNTTDSPVTPGDATPTQDTSETPQSDATTGEPTPSEDSATPTETLASTIKPWQTVMNPSINPNDSTELSDGEKDLLKALQLFAKEDINKDGNISFYDLIAISQAFGQRNVNDPSDINKDGIVNQADVDLLRKAYVFSDPSSTAPGSTPTSQAAPETPEGQPTPDSENVPPDTQNPDGSNPDGGSP
jgi:hypothetical protein